MKVMIFLDYDNFTHNITCIKKERNQDRILDLYKVHKFVLKYLSKNEQYKDLSLTHIRTYLYTGEYTDQLFRRIRDAIKDAKSSEQENYYNKVLDDAQRKQEGQKKMFDQAKTYYYFEIRRKPLQFASDKGIFQKGVDVQLAVDLVSNAYLNNYDVAVIFSGDIDLLESLKTVKNLGKHVIIFSHYSNMAKEMIRVSDMFVNLQKLDDEQLDEFTHIFQKK